MSPRSLSVGPAPSTMRRSTRAMGRRLPGRPVAVLGLIGLILGSASLTGEPSALAASATATPGASATVTPGAVRDLYEDMPSVLGGFEPEIVITRGEEHFAALDPTGPAAADQQARLMGLLAEVGADTPQLTSGYALVSQDDFFAFVVALRVEGIEPGTLLPTYLPMLYEDLIDPSGIVARVGGKDVVIVASRGEDEEFVALYVYDQGDTIWMVQGPEDVVEATLDDLPDPVERVPG